MIAFALTHDLSDVLEFVPSTTGLSVAALVREGTRNLDEVVRRASAAGVEVHALSRFAANPLARPGLVFGYGAIQTGDIEEGLRRLGRAFRDL